MTYSLDNLAVSDDIANPVDTKASLITLPHLVVVLESIDRNISIILAGAVQASESGVRIVGRCNSPSK